MAPSIAPRQQQESPSVQGDSDDALRQALAKARAFLSDGDPAPRVAAETPEALPISTSQASALESQMQQAALDAAHDRTGSRAMQAQNRNRVQPITHGAPLDPAGASTSQTGGVSQNVLEVGRPARGSALAAKSPPSPLSPAPEKFPSPLSARL